MRALPTAFLSTAVALFAGLGCQTGGQSVCDEAASYYAECTGTAQATGLECGDESAELAEQILAASCEDLSTTDGLKADSLNACVALVLPLLVIHEQEQGEACCVPYNCKRGLTCHTDGIIPTCGPKRDIGGTCDSEWQCLSELTCLGDSCEVPLSEGSPCQEGDCASGLVCALGTCSPPLALGATCEEGDCAEECVLGSCSPAVAEGGTCGEDDDCGPSLVCQDSACAVQLCDPDQFSSCGFDATCYEGRCEPRHEAGEGCRNMFDCESGLFCHHDTKVCYQL